MTCLGRFKINRLQQISDLLGADQAQFGFGTNPGNIGMLISIDSAAGGADIAAVDGLSASRATAWLFTHQGFSQGAGDGLQFVEVAAMKEVGVAEAAAFGR